MKASKVYFAQSAMTEGSEHKSFWSKAIKNRRTARGLVKESNYATRV